MEAICLINPECGEVLVLWLDWPADAATWEPIQNVAHLPVYQRYLKQNQERLYIRNERVMDAIIEHPPRSMLKAPPSFITVAKFGMGIFYDVYVGDIFIAIEQGGDGFFISRVIRLKEPLFIVEVLMTPGGEQKIVKSPVQWFDTKVQKKMDQGWKFAREIEVHRDYVHRTLNSIERPGFRCPICKTLFVNITSHIRHCLSKVTPDMKDSDLNDRFYIDCGDTIIAQHLKKGRRTIVYNFFSLESYLNLCSNYDFRFKSNDLILKALIPIDIFLNKTGLTKSITLPKSSTLEFSSKHVTFTYIFAFSDNNAWWRGTRRFQNKGRFNRFAKVAFTLRESV